MNLFASVSDNEERNNYKWFIHDLFFTFLKIFLWELKRYFRLLSLLVLMNEYFGGFKLFDIAASSATGITCKLWFTQETIYGNRKGEGSESVFTTMYRSRSGAEEFGWFSSKVKAACVYTKVILQLKSPLLSFVACV